jgi:hypothetical protein
MNIWRLFVPEKTVLDGSEGVQIIETFQEWKYIWVFALEQKKSNF